MNQIGNPPAALSEILGRMNSLADATRARTLRLVERHELSVAELCSILQAPQSTVSRHLKVLADEGWVSARPEGTSRLYGMEPGKLEPGARRLWALVREQTAGTVLAGQDDQRLQSVLGERRSRSEAFFSSSAGQWDRLRGEMYGDRLDPTAMAGLLDPDWVVGDLGCGTGPWAAMIAPFVRRVIAVDSSTAMLEAARTRLSEHDNIEVRGGDLAALPIDEHGLDAATICLVLHHAPDPGAILHEAARVLDDGGRLLLIDMFSHERVEYQRQMGHVWLGFEPAQIEAWLREAGFDSIRIQGLPPDPQAKGPALFAAVARRQRFTKPDEQAEQSARRGKTASRRRKE